MSKADKTNLHHLTTDLLTRALDEELTGPERFEVEGHLTVCEFCRSDYEALSQVSLAVESLVETQASVMCSASEIAFRRRHLEVILETAAPAPVNAPTAGRVMRRFGWGMGIAATLAFGILLAPRHDLTAPAAANAPVVAQSEAFYAQPSTIDVDGESFTSLPYSNPDLPINSAHIVQMQVPVSSLSDVGIVLEPVVSRVDRAEDASVLADVLLGSDGQPRGVHVLGAEQEQEEQ